MIDDAKGKDKGGDGVVVVTVGILQLTRSDVSVKLVYI